MEELTEDPSQNCTLILEQQPELLPIWLIGIAVSIASSVCQIGCLFFYPPSRKYDEKTLCLLSFSRTLHSVAELNIMNDFFDFFVYDFVLVSYFYSDFVLVCWMFVFSKNLYDKVVVVFNVTQHSLFKISAVIYTISIIPALPSVLIKFVDFTVFRIYYNTYACTKFMLLIINSYLFIRIFYVSFKNRTKNVSHIIKAAVISFILLCMTSLQSFFVDIYALIGHPGCKVTLWFCIVNSFQTLAMTVVFGILMSGKIRRARLTVSYSQKNSSVMTTCSQVSAVS